MPYIKEADKVRFDPIIIGAPIPVNAGELNYLLTQIIKRYYSDNGGRYQQINDIIGALEGAKLEFYRRVAAPYEDKKIEENGDVY